MEEARIRHLEMIQAVIARMAQNSFAYKGWAITLVSAALALAAAQTASAVQAAALNPARMYLLIALAACLAFWGLDGYYLYQERLFRRHYDAVRRAGLEEWQRNPFSMDTALYACEEKWLAVCFRRAVAGLHVPLALVVIAAAVILVYMRIPQ